MADVSGPCSTLPGSVRNSPKGMSCDHHDDKPAVKRVQGETDSFGAEYHDLCQECYDLHKKAEAEYLAEKATGMCEWCKNHAKDLRDRRDFEEGSCGRVYQVCGACVRKENEAAAQEMEDYGSDHLYDY